jgi:tRNA(adenine34) deaminase
MWDAAMRLALDEARVALTHQDVPVGAVVLDATGTVIAAAHNERELRGDPLAHAEVLALQRAAQAVGRSDAATQGTELVSDSTPNWRLDDCTLVVTLEPCTMCAGAIVQARIGRLVFGTFDEKAGAVASLWDVVRDSRLPHRPEVVSGIMADEAAALLRKFFTSFRTP